MEHPQRISPFMPMFESFRAELDEHHDRRERVIKASRDITAASKKIIFTLQRVRKLVEPLPQHVLKGNKQYEDAVSTNFVHVSKDLQGLDTHRYARQITGGLQEYIEAASFSHYLTTSQLIPYNTACEQLAAYHLSISVEDYLLGIYDTTGELMRFAITTMATTGAVPISGEGRNALGDLRELRAALESIDAGENGPFAKDVAKKAEVMRQSVEKVERALYGIVVRGSERPKGWMPDTSDSGGKAVEVEG